MSAIAETVLKRRQGWELRLVQVVEAARHAPYELGKHDCFRFSCAAVEALTGIDFWPRWAGTYATQAQALRRMVEYGGSFDGAISRLFGVELERWQLAHQGDVMKYVQSAGARVTPHLGVCLGSEAAVLAEEGLLFVPISVCAGAWRIG